MTKETKRGVVGTLITTLIAIGLAWAGSQGGYTTASGFPIFALCVAIAFAIQWIVFIPSFINRTEKFYDLTGGITFLTVITTSIWLSPKVDNRSWLLAGLVAVWAPV